MSTPQPNLSESVLMARAAGMYFALWLVLLVSFLGIHFYGDFIEPELRRRIASLLITGAFPFERSFFSEEARGLLSCVFGGSIAGIFTLTFHRKPFKQVAFFALIAVVLNGLSIRLALHLLGLSNN